MKHHTKVYMEVMGFKPGEHIPCEICYAMDPEKEGKPADDINHIDARGMGGNPKGDKDRIENLMATCRSHHLEYGDKKQYKDHLKRLHLAYMTTRLKDPIK